MNKKLGLMIPPVIYPASGSPVQCTDENEKNIFDSGMFLTENNPA